MVKTILKAVLFEAVSFLLAKTSKTVTRGSSFVERDVCVSERKSTEAA